MDRFQALKVNKTNERFTVKVEELASLDLPEGDVTIQVAYSSVNYKDGLAAIPDGKIITSYPMVPGIDLAGTVISSRDPRFREGDQVIVTGFEQGISHPGGFSQYTRVPADWIVPLPNGLSLKEAMTYGTAGFTAALSIHRLEQNGINKMSGPVLVTGATGGVGSMAVAMLAKNGYVVFASTGKMSESHYLLDLGAREVLNRSDLTPEKIRPLDKQRWGAAIDPVGGKTLAYILSTTKYGGAVAVCGLTGGTEVPTTVFPFILRGISLLGIDSVYCNMELRKHLWERMASDLKPNSLLDGIGSTISLRELPETLPKILEGKVRGRVILSLD